MSGFVDVLVKGWVSGSRSEWMSRYSGEEVSERWLVVEGVWVSEWVGT